MAIQFGDIILDADGEVLSKNGDIVVGDGNEQQVGAIVNANAGNFRRWPTLGCNLNLKLDSPNNSRDIVFDVQGGLELDGWRLDDMNISTDLESVDITINEVTKVTDDTQSLL